MLDSRPYTGSVTEMSEYCCCSKPLRLKRGFLIQSNLTYPNTYIIKPMFKSGPYCTCIYISIDVKLSCKKRRNSCPILPQTLSPSKYCSLGPRFPTFALVSFFALLTRSSFFPLWTRYLPKDATPMPPGSRQAAQMGNWENWRELSPLKASQFN